MQDKSKFLEICLLKSFKTCKNIQGTDFPPFPFSIVCIVFLVIFINLVSDEEVSDASSQTNRLKKSENVELWLLEVRHLVVAFVEVRKHHDVNDPVMDVAKAVDTIEVGDPEVNFV